MPRQGRGPQLYLKKRKGYESYWYIRDGKRRIATGFSESERRSAVASLAKYINRSGSAVYETDAHIVKIGVVIGLYAEDKAPDTARPRATAARLKRLLDFFGEKPVAYITPATCKRFVEWWGSEQAARRALEDLRAALTYAWKCRRLSSQVPVTMPDKAPPRERWLTKREARALIKASASWPHLLRFIIIGLYTGTRSGAILSLAWRQHAGGGHVDIENRVLYRRAPGTRETTKRQPPTRINAVLLKRLKRWCEASSGIYIVEFEGRGIDSVKRSWARARVAAGLSDDVTPHTLRHTFVTWQLQAGKSIWDVAGAAGMSPQIVARVYGHHAADFGESR